MFSKDLRIIKMFEIKGSPTNPLRFAVFDESGKCVNNANGYGFTSKKKAKAAANFIFSGGLEIKRKMKTWWKNHSTFSSKLDEISWYLFKDNDL